MNPRTHSTLALLFGVMLLAVGWWASSPVAPPLYDGLVLGNDPYRYLSPPPGYRSTPPPSSARATLRVQHGQVPPFVVTTSEAPPQAQVTGSIGAFSVPTGTATVTVSLVPMNPPAAAPAGERFDGNIYRFQALADGTPVAVTRGSTLITALRGTGAPGQPSLGIFNGGHWSVLSTVPSGVPDDYAATVVITGFVTLFVSQTTHTTAAINRPSVVLDVEVVALFSAFLAALIILIRRMRRPTPS